MSAYTKNILVGVTVLTALLLLGWMVLRFSDAPFQWFKSKQMPVFVEAPTAEGLSQGSPVFYKGVAVGRVTGIRRSENQRTVIIESMVDEQPPLPANIEAVIRTQLFGGASSINLVLYEAEPAGTQGSSWLPREEPQPQGTLARGARLHARYVGVDLLPPEFTALASDLTETSREMRRISAQLREADLVPKLAQTIDSLRSGIDKATRVVDSMQGIVGDERMREDLRQTLANFREASASANRIGQNVEKISVKADRRLDELADNGNRTMATAQARIDEVSKQLGERLTQLAAVLDNFEQASRKVNDGKGSAAMLLNDPRLYENLLDTSRELSLTVSGVRRLVEQWEEEGVPFKLR